MEVPKCRLRSIPASMRPRHKAAENHGCPTMVALGASAASMRPRHKAAENTLDGRDPINPGPASMRPRHKAAENMSPRGITDPDHVWLQ